MTIDANILVSELDKDTGASQSLLNHPTLETLYIAEYMWNEAMYVLDRKVEGWIRGGRTARNIADVVLHETIGVFASRCAVITEATYAPYEGKRDDVFPAIPTTGILPRWQ